ncbi:IS3 family transposase ISBce13 [Sporomusa carbonis]
MQIYNDSKKRYGAPKIRAVLKESYPCLSINRVQRHMKALGIKSIVHKKYRPHKSEAVYEHGANLLKRDFSTTSPNEKWVADITYIHTLKDGWCYLATVLDLHLKKVVGYSFSRTISKELVLTALDNAVKSQKPSAGLIIHSDRGSQYTSFEYRHKVEQELKFKLSYSRKGCPYDNAVIESFHSILKKELVYTTTFLNYQHARFELFQYIEGFYNRKRIHSKLNFMSPIQFEQSLKKIA